VPDGEGFTAALGARGRGGLVAALQRAWPAAVAALALTAAALAGAYFHGLPAAARWTASAMPRRLDAAMGHGVLELLDAQLLGRSRLPAGRRADLVREFGTLADVAAPAVPYEVTFRTVRGPRGGKVANAFALPGGTIVVLDGLVTLADDEEVLAVLAHELGHVSAHHPTRQVLQGAGVAAAAGLVWGDFSSQAANVPAVLLSLRYSRELEREADLFAVGALRATGRTVRPLVDAFRALEATAVRGEEPPGFLSTHPPLRKRIEALEAEPDGAAPRP
jgi:Zn-dependent protease with chaperone function